VVMSSITRRACIVALALAGLWGGTGLPAFSQIPTTVPTDVAKPYRQDSRPRVAVVGFTVGADADPRDHWTAVAIEELMARRLRRVPGLVVVPTIRLYQGRDELTPTGGKQAAWSEVTSALGATHQLSGRCEGAGDALSVTLSLRRVQASDSAPTEGSIPVGRLFDTLDRATRWALAHLEPPEFELAIEKQVFAKPSRSPTAVEYYARATGAARAGRLREAVRYASQSLDNDKGFRPSLTLLAQLELQMGPSGRGSAGRRLRALGDLARLDSDDLDRARAELGLSLLLQSGGATDAARTRAQTALDISSRHKEPYGLMAALTAMCDLHLLTRPAPGRKLTAEAEEAFKRGNLSLAAQWQHALMDLLGALGDKVTGLPAASKLAMIYEQLGQPERALEMHQRTLAIAQRLKSRRHEATAWLYLGQWYGKQERWPDALDAITHCLDLAEESSKPAVRMILGGIHQTLEQPDKALQQFELAYGEIRKTDDLVNQCTCLREMARARMQLGQREEAVDALQQAADIAHVLELQEEAELREELAAWRAGQ